MDAELRDDLIAYPRRVAHAHLPDEVPLHPEDDRAAIDLCHEDAEALISRIREDDA